jgi:DNA (cytosine-5)-methyltransferase 1
MSMTYGSLFTGIGGFDLGLDRAGMKCVWQVEKDASCRKVLERHWPGVRRCDDVKAIPFGNLDGWRVDVIAGGFPCQDISIANPRAVGIEGERSGLWSEFARIIRILRPSYVVIENVPAITFRGLDRVLFDLAESGYDAEWDTLPAQMFGAPHRRERLFVVAYAPGERCDGDAIFSGCSLEEAIEKQASRLRCWPGVREPSPALPNRIRWCPDRKLCRMVDELPDELDRYRQLGNAVVPEVAEWIARRITSITSAEER